MKWCDSWINHMNDIQSDYKDHLRFHSGCNKNCNHAESIHRWTLAWQLFQKNYCTYNYIYIYIFNHLFVLFTNCVFILSSVGRPFKVLMATKNIFKGCSIMKILLTLQLLWVTKTEFRYTLLIQYQLDKWCE